MVRNFVVIGICLCLFCSFAEARTKGLKWVYHVAQEGQTVEQIVRGYSVLYEVDLESFCKWNKVNKWHRVQRGDIFMIANKPKENARIGQEKLAARKKEKKRKKGKDRDREQVVVAAKSGSSQIKDREMFEAIRFAGDQTGVRQAFLAGMFQVETGLGKNTGACHYKKARMGLPEQALFEEVCQDLGYDPDSMKVSCPQRGQRGGAMGVAQFLPSTWLIYRDRVAKVMGKDDPNPWDPRDAAVAMALKVANDAPGVIHHDKRAEADAAKMYFSGTTDNRYNGHAKKVLAAAKKFEDQF